MNRQLVVYNHPVEGHFEVNQNAKRISVTCRWPFDLEANDWIEIQNVFDLDEYSSAVANAMASGRGKAQGMQGGSIVIEYSCGNRETIVEISNNARGWAAKSLRLKIAKPITNFVAAK